MVAMLGQQLTLMQLDIMTVSYVLVALLPIYGGIDCNYYSYSLLSDVLQALNRDVAEVNELLPEQDRLELLDMVQSSSTRQNKREV